MMHAYIEKHQKLWKERRFVTSTAAGILLIAFALLLSDIETRYFLNISAPAVPDLLLDAFPVLRMQDVLVWGIPCVIVFILTVLFFHPEHIPFTLKTLGLLFLIRCFFIVLTPLGIRPDQVLPLSQGFFAELAYASNGFFFSGHVSFPFMLALIFWRKKLVRLILLGATFVFAFGVVFAHTHYSIDVFAVPFIAPTVLRLSKYLFGDDARVFRKLYAEAKNTSLLRPLTS